MKKLLLLLCLCAGIAQGQTYKSTHKLIQFENDTTQPGVMTKADMAKLQLTRDTFNHGVMKSEAWQMQQSLSKHDTVKENPICKERGHVPGGYSMSTLLYCPPYQIDEPDFTIMVYPDCNSHTTICARCRVGYTLPSRESRDTIWKRTDFTVRPVELPKYILIPTDTAKFLSLTDSATTWTRSGDTLKWATFRAISSIYNRPDTTRLIRDTFEHGVMKSESWRMAQALSLTDSAWLAASKSELLKMEHLTGSMTWGTIDTISWIPKYDTTAVIMLVSDTTNNEPERLIVVDNVYVWQKPKHQNSGMVLWIRGYSVRKDYGGGFMPEFICYLGSDKKPFTYLVWDLRDAK